VKLSKENNAPLNIVFAGTPALSVPTLQALIDSKHNVTAIYTQPDRPAGRGRHLTASPVKGCAEKNNLPVYQPLSLKKPDVQDKFRKLQPDLLIVMAYGLILPKAILDIPRFGCINVHTSLLPRWRGAAPIPYAILSGDKETGITIMQMDEGLDTGDMLYKENCVITDTDTTDTLSEKLAALSPNALLTALNKLQQGEITPEKQDDSLTCYASKIKKQDAELDWTLTATELDCKVRAFNPWPVAQTHLDGQVLRIWETQVLEPEVTHGLAGTLLAATEEGIDIAAAKGILRLTKIQLPGGRALSAADVLHSKKELFVECARFGE